MMNMRYFMEAVRPRGLEQYARKGVDAFAPDDPDWGNGVPTDAELRRFYTHRVATFRRILARNNGMIPAWRAIAVRDVDAWIEELESHGKVGAHWTWKKSAASTAYAGEVHGDVTVIMCSMIPDHSIDWEATMDANGNRPWECEILPVAAFAVTSVLNDTGKVIYRPRRTRFTPDDPRMP